MIASKVKQLGGALIFVASSISLFMYFGSVYGGFPPSSEVLSQLFGSLILAALATIVLLSLIEWSQLFYQAPSASAAASITQTTPL